MSPFERKMKGTPRVIGLETGADPGVREGLNVL